MSEEVREEISAAVNTVAGISCSPYYVQSVGAGEASVRYGQTEHPDRFGGIVTWEVVLGLPQDVADAERLIDKHSKAIKDALRPVLVVRRSYAARSTFGTTQTNVLVIEGTREED